MTRGENAHLAGVGAGNSVAWWATEDSDVNYNLPYSICGFPIASNSRHTCLPWRQPPYGSKLRNRFISGWRPSNKTVFIAAGSDAWRVARRWDSEPGHRAILCLPPDADPSTFDWAVAAGLDCVVFVRGDVIEGIIDRLAAHLLRAGAGLVVACGDNMSMIAYRRSSHEGQGY
jgi:hypothetical protein